MSVLMTITPALQHHISAEEYLPAYDGESAGLDLYNAGPDIVIEPCLNDMVFRNQLYAARKYVGQRIVNWHDVDQQVRKKYYKTLIPTGLKVNLQFNQVGIIKERGSVTKTPLVLRAGVIDPGYTDQIFINAINLSPFPFVIKAGEKTPFQLVIMLCDNEFKAQTPDEFEAQVQALKRQDGKIGSSD